MTSGTRDAESKRRRTGERNLARRIDRLLKFLPMLESREPAGNWSNSEPDAMGRVWMPTFDFTPGFSEFIRALEDNDWVRPFDWPGWQPEAERYFATPDLMAAADVGVLRKLLTTHVRKERFLEGHLNDMVKSGHLAAIVRRLGVIREGLRDDAPPGPSPGA